MTVDECFDILDGLLGTDGYIAITEAVKKLVKQNNELKEQLKTPCFPKSDDVVQIGSLLTTYSNVMKWKQSHKEVEELKEQNNEFKESDKHLNKCIDNIRDQYLEQKEQNETLKQTVSNYYDTQRELMSESCVPNDTAFETKVIEIRNENKTLKEENEELKKKVEELEDNSDISNLLLEFYTGNNPDNPDKDFIDSWCTEHSMSDKKKEMIYSEFEIDSDED